MRDKFPRNIFRNFKRHDEKKQINVGIFKIITKRGRRWQYDKSINAMFSDVSS